VELTQLKILIIEDQVFLNGFLRDNMRRLGNFEIDSAYCGSKALELLSNNNYQLVFLDLMLPEFDGVKLLQLMSKNNHKPNLVLMSSLPVGMLECAGLVAKTNGFTVIDLISKPVQNRHLQEITSKIKNAHTFQFGQMNNPVQFQDPTYAELSSALANGEIQAWFQPKVNINSSRIVGAEALVRWVHPKYGLLLPGSFIKRFEKHQLDKELLYFMLGKALQAQANWLVSGYSINISINLPIPLLEIDGIADDLEKFVTNHGSDPKRITFELIESSPPKCLSNYYASAWHLRMKGFGLAQDDFGTGYSSYANLSKTPFTELKIDRSFTHNCLTSHNQKNVLASIVRLGHMLGLKVIAEGVETINELMYLRKMGCDEAQGYYYSGAVTEWQFEALLNSIN